PPPQVPAHTASVAPPVVAGGGRGMASYSPPITPAPASYNPPPGPATYTPASYNPAPGPEITGSVTAPASVVRKPTSSGQWSWDGGTAVTVAQGETVDSIAHRHGVPVAVIMEANNLASPNSIQTGQRLVLPRYGSSAAPPAPAVPPPSHATAPVTAPVLASVASKPAPAVAASASPHAAG